MSPCFPHKSSTEEAIFRNSKAMKEDKAKLKEFAPEIQSSRCIRISLFKCNLSVTSDEIRFFGSEAQAMMMENLEGHS